MTMSFEPPTTAQLSLYAAKQFRPLMVRDDQPTIKSVLPDGTLIEQSEQGHISRVNYSSGTSVWIPEPRGPIFVTSPLGTTFVGRQGQLWLSID